MDALYSAEVTSRGGREGRVTSPDAVIDLALAIPAELGGPGGQATNPEQLFAACYAASFEGTLKAVANRGNGPPGRTAVTALVSIGNTPDGMFGLSVELRVWLPDLPALQAELLMEQAHRFCPYSKAIRNALPVSLRLV